MISPPPLQIPISTPQGGLTTAWLAWFDQLRNTVANSEAQDDVGPSAISALTSLSAALLAALQELQTLPRKECDDSAALQELQTLPSKECDVSFVLQELQTLPSKECDVSFVLQELQTLPRQELGTFAALQQANLPWTVFDTTPEHVPTDIGTVAWDGGTTLGIQMTANVNQPVGESQYYYIKASATITKGQLIMFDGAVGSSGVLQGKPATGVTNGQLIMGVAAESIANNDFGLVSSFGLVRGFNTSGAPYGETWADGDILYYNPSFAGGLTKTQPLAPIPHIVVAAVVNAATGGSGSVFVRVQAEPLVSQLSDVYVTSLANNDILVYDGTDQRWENKPASTSSIGNLSGGAAGSVPYQTAPNTTTFLPIGTASQVLKVNSTATAPEWVSSAALTKVDDTNVTLTLGGSPATSLLAATSLTLGWTGQLDVTRGGTGQSSYTNGQLLIGNSTGNTLTKATLTAGSGISITNGAGSITIASTAGGGSVTSVGLSMPAQFTVSGSPVTSSGTLTAAWASQSASTVLAAPNGSSGTPTFRQLEATEVGYTRSGGSASYVQTKIDEILSVKDFGAVGNGTADDTTAIQNALNAGTGRIVYFPAGTYRISSTIVVKTKTTLTGDGINKSIIKLTSGFSASSVGLRNDVITGTANVYYDTDLAFYNLTFDGNSNATRTADLVAILKVANVTFSNCSFQNSTFIGLAMTANKNMLVTDCFFTANGRPKPSTVSAPALWIGTTAAGTPYDAIIENNYFRDNNWSAAYFMPTRGSFSNNNCIDNGESTVFCNNTGAYLLIQNNDIVGAARSNISASGIECGAPYTIITGNHINSCGAEGIALTDVQNVTITNNQIFNNGQDTAYYPFPNGITIVSTVSSPNQPDHIQISGNRIGDRQATKTQYAAIGFSGSGAACTNVAIYNNDFAEQKTATYYNLISSTFGTGCYTVNNYSRTGSLLSPFKYAQFTLNAGAGAQTITGIGFRPRAIEFVAVLTSTTQAFTSISSHDGTSGTVMYSAVDGTGQRAGNTTGVINIKDSAGGTVAEANLTSLDVDGFTINVVTGNAAVVCNVKCFP